MTTAEIIAGLETALGLVTQLAPIIAETSPQAAAAVAVITTVSTYAQTVLDAATSADSTLSSDDQAAIQASVTNLQSQNAVLAAQIAAS